MKYFVQFGAGNIGRSFIGQLFSRAGYEVIFIESALPLVRIINKKREYRIIIKRNDTPDEEIVIRNIQALHIDETQAVRNAILKADYVATSVGPLRFQRWHLFLRMASNFVLSSGLINQSISSLLKIFAMELNILKTC